MRSKKNFLWGDTILYGILSGEAIFLSEKCLRKQYSREDIIHSYSGISYQLSFPKLIMSGWTIYSRGDTFHFYRYITNLLFRALVYFVKPLIYLYTLNIFAINYSALRVCQIDKSAVRALIKLARPDFVAKKLMIGL